VIVYVVGTQRSGTTVFRHLLCSAGAYNADEIMHGQIDYRSRFYAYLASRIATEPKLAHPVHLARLFPQFVNELQRNAESGTVVADIKYGDLPLLDGRHEFNYARPLLLALLATTATAIVHVFRRNDLRSHVSNLISLETGQWGIQRGEAPAPRIAVMVDCDQLPLALELAEQSRRKVALWLTAAPRVEEIAYEDMFENADLFSRRAMQVATSVMGPGLDPTPTTVQMNPAPLDALVVNFDDVQRALAGTEWEWMLAG
jgi:LPS sulfotransferase NodH